jgi:uncharacterized protein YndB with AHSA1/START domain
MPDIIHRVGIRASLAKTYEALATIPGLSGWWTEDTSGESRVGGKIAFSFRRATGEMVGTIYMDVMELSAPTRVRWQGVDDPPEWHKTDITFDLSEQDGMTIVLFGHRGWREESEFMAHCSTKWAIFLISLRDYLESGTGNPSPRDVTIGNWH